MLLPHSKIVMRPMDKDIFYHGEICQNSSILDDTVQPWKMIWAYVYGNSCSGNVDKQMHGTWRSLHTLNWCWCIASSRKLPHPASSSGCGRAREMGHLSPSRDACLFRELWEFLWGVFMINVWLWRELDGISIFYHSSYIHSLLRTQIPTVTAMKLSHHTARNGFVSPTFSQLTGEPCRFPVAHLLQPTGARTFFLISQNLYIWFPLKSFWILPLYHYIEQLIHIELSQLPFLEGVNYFWNCRNHNPATSRPEGSSCWVFFQGNLKAASLTQILGLQEELCMMCFLFFEKCLNILGSPFGKDSSLTELCLQNL